jgi:tetratricopeptide (TPR) repeat protein
VPGLLILMHGSEGTTWFCDMLDRHPEASQVLYEPFRRKRVVEARYATDDALEVFRAIFARDVEAPGEVWSGHGEFPKRGVSPVLDNIRASLGVKVPFIKMRLRELPEDRLRELVRTLDVRLVLLSRRDKLKQAISQVRKQEMHLHQRRYKKAVGAVFVDPAKAIEFADYANQVEQDNQDFADSCGQPYLSIAYEDLQRDVSATMHEVAEFVGIDPEGIVTETDFVKVTPDNKQAAIANYCEFYDTLQPTRYGDELVAPSEDRRASEAQIIRQAVKNNAENPYVLCAWGAMLSRQGKTKQAEQAYRKAIALDPNDAKTLRRLALILERRGVLDEAARMLRTAIKTQRDGDASTLREHLARVTAKQNTVSAKQQADKSPGAAKGKSGKRGMDRAAKKAKRARRMARNGASGPAD